MRPHNTARQPRYTCLIPDDVKRAIRSRSQRALPRVMEYLTTQLSLDQKPDTLVVATVPLGHQVVYEVLSGKAKRNRSIHPDVPAVVIRYFKGDLDLDGTPVTVLLPPELAGV